MALNHLNLTVPDVLQTRAFFEKYFEFQCIAGQHSDTLVVLIDRSGFVLSLNNFNNAAEVAYPGGFHIGFRLDSRQKVDEYYVRLRADGFDVKAPRDFHGGWTFYFRAPGDLVVEVLHQPLERREDGATFSQANSSQEKLSSLASR